MQRTRVITAAILGLSLSLLLSGCGNGTDTSGSDVQISTPATSPTADVPSPSPTPSVTTATPTTLPPVQTPDQPPAPKPTVTSSDDPVLAYIGFQAVPAGKGQLTPSCELGGDIDGCAELVACRDGLAVVREEHAEEVTNFAYLAQDAGGWTITEQWTPGGRPPDWVLDATEGSGDYCEPRW